MCVFHLSLSFFLPPIRQSVAGSSDYVSQSKIHSEQGHIIASAHFIHAYTNIQNKRIVISSSVHDSWSLMLNPVN